MFERLNVYTLLSIVCIKKEQKEQFSWNPPPDYWAMGELKFLSTFEEA